MRNYRIKELKEQLFLVLGSGNLLVSSNETAAYRRGIRVGCGNACMVALPRTLLQLWKTLEICINLDKIIILQAANTGLTGGSTPFGDDYDRDVVIINTVAISQLFLINNGLQVIALPGTTLYHLEESLAVFDRGPHSKIGSSCIGASVIGGVCNNSGGNLVNRGPAYTELALFAQLKKDRSLELVNHLGIELGSTPEEILLNLETGNFELNNIKTSQNMASDKNYQDRVRDIQADTPARFNADKRRLYETSGCAGKLAVFAVRLDTFPLPNEEKVFFVGTNNPQNFTNLRKEILSEHSILPDMGEYMHKSYFEGSYKYCKDNFIFIKYFGTKALQLVFKLKNSLDIALNNIKFLPNNITDIHLQLFAQFLPHHLSKRIRKISKAYEHYMIFLASDSSIPLIRNTLTNYQTNNQIEFLECSDEEGSDLLLHRYVAGAAPSRYQKIETTKSSELLPLDIALPRNSSSWYEIFPEDILSQMSNYFYMGHFLCMVFHCDFVVNKDTNIRKLKERIFKILDDYNAKYPAEHNVGHLYKADYNLKEFYMNLDPTNSFNSGIGKTSKNKNYV